MLVAILLLGLVSSVYGSIPEECLKVPKCSLECPRKLNLYYYDFKTDSCKNKTACPPSDFGNAFTAEKYCQLYCGIIKIRPTEPPYPREPLREGGLSSEIFGEGNGEVEDDDGAKDDGTDGAKLADVVKASRATASICNMQKDAGHCKAHMAMFYYNKFLGKCQSFMYGGCGGNPNRFSTAWECQKKCGGPLYQKPGVVPSSSCTQPLVSGHYCSYGYGTRYWYNQYSGSCQSFTYQGCGANSNNFYSYADCQRSCGGYNPGYPYPHPNPYPGPHYPNYVAQSKCGQSLSVGYCGYQYTRWWYDRNSGTCKSFYWGGCGGNSNRFNSYKDCQKSCHASCRLPVHHGHCGSRITRWYYNYNTNQCHSFIYYGCGGNQNNYHSWSACSSACI